MKGDISLLGDGRLGNPPHTAFLVALVSCNDRLRVEREEGAFEKKYSPRTLLFVRDMMIVPDVDRRNSPLLILLSSPCHSR